MADYKTPSVYIVEKNAFPPSVVAVPTAVPVFIGYTEKAERNGKALTYMPTKIASMAEYAALFGGAFKTKFIISNTTSSPADSSEETFTINGQNLFIKFKPNNELYFYNAIRLFYLNGGNECYILSVGNYDYVTANGIAATDYFGTEDNKHVFKILEKEWEPTLIILPDVVAKKPTPTDAGAYEFYIQALQHCYATQSRFGIFDVARSVDGSDDDAISLFREKMVSPALKYGAAYYPWLKTTVVDESEVDFNNLEDSLATLKSIIPPTETTAVILINDMAAAPTAALQFHQSLLAASPVYKQLMAAIRARLNLLPPSSAMAGIYKSVDTARGVWKAPANVGVSSITAPEVNISSEKQELMNVDPISGKSINIIRTFPDIGTLVWGGRTLDGNSQDWKYINVRRTMIFIEQSLKLATRNFVFEPNDTGTWITIKSMLNNFLFNLWKQGALPGSTPDVAYSVQVGLGVTMTAADILDGIMRITVLLAVVRPAEFIEITFQQQQQQA
jgi:uncharacterized protein